MVNQADIVTLMNGDTAKYVRTHSDAVEGFSEAVSVVMARETTQFIPAAGVSVVAQRITKVSGMVTGTITVKLDTAQNMSGSFEFGTLPEGFIPQMNVQLSSIVNGNITFNINVRSTGVIMGGGKAYIGNTETQVPAGAYISINFSHEAK